MSPHDKIDLRRWQAGDVLRIAGVRQLVEHGDVHVRMVPRHVSHEVRANEAASAGHQNITRLEYAAARHAVHHFSIPSHANGWGARARMRTPSCAMRAFRASSVLGS